MSKNPSNALETLGTVSTRPLSTKALLDALVQRPFQTLLEGNLKGMVVG